MYLWYGAGKAQVQVEIIGRDQTPEMKMGPQICELRILEKVHKGVPTVHTGDVPCVEVNKGRRYPTRRKASTF